ncbi:MAG: hypothetical protein ACLRYY_07575 [Anaerobutyricum soehngenii]
MAHQKYIVNVIIDADKKVVLAVAGDAIEAHAAGCKFLQDYCQVVPKKAADIAISTNGGYPLDQNMYQSVKGINTAETSSQKKMMTVIMVFNCGDGHGESFCGLAS